MKNKDVIIRLLSYTLLVLFVSCTGKLEYHHERWSEQEADEWFTKVGWKSGCNFNPSTSINQLEMWQADTFDPKTIEKELGWAEELGFNSMRVYFIT